MRPPNVGFGLSYALPIVVAALTAIPGTLLIVESPEAHLHPAGQSAIGHFLAQVAGSGVQTVVESHSDHVLNGIRRAVAESRVIQADDVVVHFFGTSGASRLEIKDSGAVTEWPEGFFDQTETDLSHLARIRTST
jgi:predicted ATPase